MYRIEYAPHDLADAIEDDVNEYDEVNRNLGPADVDVELLRATLVKLTDHHLVRWDQKRWCAVAGGVDVPTPADLAARRYHDFELSDAAVARIEDQLRDFRPYDDDRLIMPVADCGTAFCLAGQVAVDTGHTFVAPVSETLAHFVVPTDRVDAFIAGADDAPTWRTAAVVACEKLRLNGRHAGLLFDGDNSLLSLWAIGYAVAGGRLELPDSLPADERNPEYPTAADVRRAVTDRIAWLATQYDDVEFARLVDLDLLNEVNAYLANDIRDMLNRETEVSA